jgi:hypothetical protein
MEAAAALSEMQMVAVGRLRVCGAVVAVDDSVAAVLRADSRLIAGVLNAGALRVVSLENLAADCRLAPTLGSGISMYGVGMSGLPKHTYSYTYLHHTLPIHTHTQGLEKLHNGAYDYVVLVCDLSERVHAALLALAEDAGGNIRSVALTAPSSLKRCAEGELRLGANAPPIPLSWAPLFFAPLPCVPQPTVLVAGAVLPPAHGAAATPESLGALAFQTCVMMEGLSGSEYSVFTLGARPRALAAAMKEWSSPVRSAVANGQWRDESQIAPAHLIILDRDADLVTAADRSDLKAGATIDYIISLLPPCSSPPSLPHTPAGVAALYHADTWEESNRAASTPPPAPNSLGAGEELLTSDDPNAVQLLRGLCQCGKEDGFKLVENSLRDALRNVGGAAGEIEGAAVPALFDSLTASAKSDAQIRYKGLLEVSGKLKAALEADQARNGGGGGAGRR